MRPQAVPPIAFVSDSPLEDQSVWLRHLIRALPGERIIPLDELPPDERRLVDVAIVADPDPQKLKNLPALEWVQSLWAGVEKIAREFSDAPFRIVRLEDPEMARKMAEAVVAWTLYLHRDMPAYAAQQRARIWKELPHTPAGGRHIGFIGLGNLGMEAARALRRLHFQVSGWSRSEKTVDGVATYCGEDGLYAMLQAVDIVVCLIPVTPETRGLIGEKTLRAMRPGAQIVNFARGAIVDTKALLAALDSGHIEHAVLDVFDEEPLPQASPLWDHPRITVLPHISGPTNRATASAIVAKNIETYRLTGTIPPALDMKRGY